MSLRSRGILGSGPALVAVLVTQPAGAQTTLPTTGAVVAPSQQMLPERFIGGVDLGQGSRPQNQTPAGVNYDDCIHDLTLQYRAIVTLPATAGDTVQVWASQGADCTSSLARANGSAQCWRLDAGLGASVLTSQAEPFTVRVQDVIGGQSTVGQNPTAPVSFGSSACLMQSSPSATQFNIFMMAIEPDGITMDGIAWNAPLPVDVVGPAPPALTGVQPGDTLLTVNWTPNVDSDTGGYDVFVDPHPGSAVAPDASTDASVSSNATLVCPEAGTESDGFRVELLFPHDVAVGRREHLHEHRPRVEQHRRRRRHRDDGDARRRGGRGERRGRRGKRRRHHHDPVRLSRRHLVPVRAAGVYGDDRNGHRRGGG